MKILMLGMLLVKAGAAFLSLKQQQAFRRKWKALLGRDARLRRL